MHANKLKLSSQQAGGLLEEDYLACPCCQLKCVTCFLQVCIAVFVLNYVRAIILEVKVILILCSQKKIVVEFCL